MVPPTIDAQCAEAVQFEQRECERCLSDFFGQFPALARAHDLVELLPADCLDVAQRAETELPPLGLMRRCGVATVLCKEPKAILALRKVFDVWLNADAGLVMIDDEVYDILAQRVRRE